MNEIPEGMKALRDEMAETATRVHDGVRWLTATWIANDLLAPGGPLWPALRLIGLDALRDAALYYGRPVDPVGLQCVLEGRGITGPLAAACLAAAEAQS